MDFSSLEFKRKFSLSMYKNFKIKLCEMNFLKDFVNDKRGDLYPVREKSADCAEFVENNRYILRQGYISRMIGQFFPFATYEVTFSAIDGEIGFRFDLVDKAVVFTLKENRIFFVCGDHREEIEILTASDAENTLLISCRPGAFDIYWKQNGKAEFQRTIYESGFQDANTERIFENGYVFLNVSGNMSVREVLAYIDNGVSVSDIRPIKYEDGTVMLENGKMYLTISIRMQESSFQSVFSWIPGTAELEMTGAVFYDCGDGKWRNYIAPVILYHRERKEWLVWVSSFEHKHILAYAAFDGDPRFGVNVIDVTFMEAASEDSSLYDFVGFKGDEDPDLFYDKERDIWLLAICRIDPRIDSYVYLFFESKHPFKDYQYIGCGQAGAETGGSFVKMGGELLFVCGNDPKSRSEYRIYSKQGMTTAKFNYPDGGFRGWGSLFPIKQGSRTRYFWLTFDRHNGSDYKWSYGNFYCFEASYR